MRVRHIDGMTDAQCFAEARKRHRWGALGQALASVGWWLSTWTTEPRGSDEH